MQKGLADGPSPRSRRHSRLAPSVSGEAGQGPAGRTQWRSPGLRASCPVASRTRRMLWCVRRATVWRAWLALGLKESRSGERSLRLCVEQPRDASPRPTGIDPWTLAKPDRNRDVERENVLRAAVICALVGSQRRAVCFKMVFVHIAPRSSGQPRGRSPLDQARSWLSSHRRIEVPALRRGRLTGRLYGLQHSPVVHRLLADCERLRRRQLSSFAPRRLMT